MSPQYITASPVISVPYVPQQSFMSYELQWRPPVSRSPLCPLHEQTGAAAGRWWCQQCKWGHTGSPSAASSKRCLECGRGRPIGLGWTTRSSSMPERPAASTAHTLGLRKETMTREVKEMDKSREFDKRTTEQHLALHAVNWRMMGINNLIHIVKKSLHECLNVYQRQEKWVNDTWLKRQHSRFSLSNLKQHSITFSVHINTTNGKGFILMRMNEK